MNEGQERAIAEINTVLAEAAAKGQDLTLILAQVTDLLRPAPVRPRTLVQAGCEDCDLITNHTTRTEALRAVDAHVLETGHWPLISDQHGWHRP